VDSTTVDLCSGSEITTDTLFITNHLTLVWYPPDSSLAARMVSKRLIITVFGTGMYNLNFLVLAVNLTHWRKCDRLLCSKKSVTPEDSSDQ
jgi:hypothetical protein